MTISGAGYFQARHRSEHEWTQINRSIRAATLHILEHSSIQALYETARETYQETKRRFDDDWFRSGVYQRQREVGLTARQRHEIKTWFTRECREYGRRMKQYRESPQQSTWTISAMTNPHYWLEIISKSKLSRTRESLF